METKDLRQTNGFLNDWYFDDSVCYPENRNNPEMMQHYIDDIEWDIADETSKRLLGEEFVNEAYEAVDYLTNEINKLNKNYYENKN